MVQYINKSAVVAEIENLLDKNIYREIDDCAFRDGNKYALYRLRSKLDTLEVIDPYEQCVQYPSIEDGIKAHAETYSFNIESELFNQLTEEQQKLWRKEIEQACISGGDAGVGLARDIRYEENVKAKDVYLEKELKEFLRQYYNYDYPKQYQDGTGSNIMPHVVETAKYFFNLGLKAQKGE